MRRWLYMILCLLVLIGCEENRLTDGPALPLEFSRDTICFDTVFTTQGSATQRMVIYNPNSHAVKIERVWLESGQYYHLNVDGEANLELCRDLFLRGKDSLMVFVRVHIDPQKSNTPVLVEDQMHVSLKGSVQSVLLQAYGQDAHIIRSKRLRSDYDTRTFEADKPYLIFDTIVANHIVFEPGAQIYMHQGTSMIAFRSITAPGTKEQPIVIRGDRRDNLFDSVPYLYAAGAWGGIYMQQDGQQSCTCQMDYVDILSGNVGLYCMGQKATQLPEVQLNGCRIHNHAAYGLVLIHSNAQVSNCEISNCASYCVYLQGGKQDFLHTTIASFFNATDIRIQSTGREDVAAVYIDNLSKESPTTNASFRNCIITGVRKNQLMVATPFSRYYPGEFVGNFLKTDTLSIPHARCNTYYTDSLDTVPLFKQEYYQYKEYRYYDFQLDSLSPALGIGDSLTALSCPLDRWGKSRANIHPDAGCYQH